MTRVLCVTSWYPPHHFGGYELSCMDVMDRLSDRGHHIEVLTSNYHHDNVAADAPAGSVATVHRELELYFRDGLLWSPSPFRRAMVERHNLAALDAAIEAAQPDVVAVWHVGAMSLSMLNRIASRGLPMVHAVSDDWPVYAPRLDAWSRAVNRNRLVAGLAQAVTRIPSHLPDLDGTGAFCFISELTRQRCRNKSRWQFPMSSIIYSGIDGRLFGREPDVEALRARARSNNRIQRLLYVGRVDPRKGLRTLIRALKHLPDAQLVIDGRSADAECSLVEEWSLEAGVTDRITMQCSDRGDLPALYDSADVCIFPSEWAEPFGLVPLEAMARGTPVVASGVGGSAEFLFDGKNCVLFEPGDEESLAAAVLRIEADADLRDDLALGGFESAEFFDSEHLADAFEAWYDSAASGFENKPPDRMAPRFGLRTDNA